MNRSWRNNSSSSPGFVYFNVNNSYQSSASDTSDFLSFGDTPPRGSPKYNRFSPNDYSSPQKFNKSPRNFNKRNNYRYSGGHSNRSFNNLNNSFHSSYNSNTRRRESGPHHNKKIDRGVKNDMTMYFDHTSVKDPWAELEENLRKKREAKSLESTNLSDDKNEHPDVENEESSSDSEQEQESESEIKSSSSGVDEETT